MSAFTKRLREAQYIMFSDGWASTTAAIEAANIIEQQAAEIASLKIQNYQRREFALHDEVVKARNKALEEAAKIAEAHVICDWSRLPGKAVDDTFGRCIASAIRDAGRSALAEEERKP